MSKKKKAIQNYAKYIANMNHPNFRFYTQTLNMEHLQYMSMSVWKSEYYNNWFRNAPTTMTEDNHHLPQNK